ncbi:MAG: hypothetical protein PVH11_05400 [Anaerolineae bacterium]|jgi:hypothetical protein
MPFKDRGRILRAVGGLLFLVGGVAAVMGPVEIYCFYLFSRGGPFYYEGFGVGSFMFANLACQIAGYYLIAALCLPLGYGHVRLRRWARTLAETLLWAWLVVGVPLTILFLLVLFSAKELSLATGAGAAAVLLLSYPLLPVLLLRFYRGENVRQTLTRRDPEPAWIERWPVPVLVLGSLLTFYVLALHIPLLLNGLFPLFGHWLSGLDGFVALTVAILALAFLTWGIWRQAAWAWWPALLGLVLLLLSSTWTLAGTSWAQLLALLNLPPTELDILDGVPLQGIHLALFIGLPLVLTVAAMFLSRRQYGASATARGSEVE